MRTFDVTFTYKGKRLAYRKLSGKKAIKILEDLTKKGFECGATTQENNIFEGITLEQMKESVL
jgi:hypothetical protein